MMTRRPFSAIILGIIIASNFLKTGTELQKSIQSVGATRFLGPDIFLRDDNIDLTDIQAPRQDSQDGYTYMEDGEELYACSWRGCHVAMRRRQRAGWDHGDG